MVVLIDGAAVLRSIPLGYESTTSNNLSESSLWKNHLSLILGLIPPPEDRVISKEWRALDPERRIHIWKSWTKPGSQHGLDSWDALHTKFSVTMFGGMYYMYDDVDMSINVVTTERTEMWLSRNGLTVTVKNSKWMSSR
ncbi:hypothetical protein TrLO_g2271 [Triparma laevis f. longispina]|uniref:Uncharacterized protein n=1 Tax=Triparma laevis f. longispina TaxID=1714387 RepID=A0A9W7F6F9_9STRA|nr:hypothetical protein TrLO_g2271 [Triparma laevis f. longispina]